MHNIPMYIIKLCKRYKRQNSHYFLDYKLNPEEDTTKALKHIGLVSNKNYTIDPVTLLGLFTNLNILLENINILIAIIDNWSEIVWKILFNSYYLFIYVVCNDIAGENCVFFDVLSAIIFSGFV